ncbi:MAG: alpha/beta hydrolase, partial [Negativicutes bacterium]|nr:alpha/beta hydrolase [Negativicutes bacterium]
MHKGQGSGIDTDQWKALLQRNGWLWDAPEQARACLILAHGAGAPMDSEFMNQIARKLAARGVAVLRFEFAYMAQRRLD